MNKRANSETNGFDRWSGRISVRAVEDIGSRFGLIQVAAILLAFFFVFSHSVFAQTTTGTAATGNTLFNSTFNCSGCHSAATASRYNAINAGGHITYANTQGMGGTSGSAQNYADIAAYLATLFTDLAAQSVTFEVAKAISIPNISLNTGYGDYAGLQTVSSPSRGGVTYSGTTATYTPSSDQCGSDSFTYRAYRTAANGSGTSNTRTVSLTISNPSAPNITTSASAPGGTYLTAYSYTPTSTGGNPYIYDISVGTLPTGLSLNTSTGAITGSPSVVGGPTSVTLRARNCLNGSLTGQSSTKSLSITISKANQAALTALINASSANATFTYSSPNGTATLSSSGGSGTGAVSYGSSNTGVCTVSGTTLTLVGGGTCTITATKAADTNYNVATDTIGVTVNKASQTISFSSSAPASAVVGGTTYTPTGTATSGLTPTITIDATASSVCSISGGIVSFLTVGTCVVNINQAGNTNYNAATQVQQSFAVGKGSQTISFPAQSPSSQTYAASGTFAINPVASGGASGNAVTYSSTTTGVCTVSSSTVTMVSAGTCTITANQAGNTNYNAATQVTQSVTINQASQTISFAAQVPSTQTFAASGTFAINPVATGGASGNAVTYSSTSTGVCTVSGTTVTMVSVGTCTIAANQAGNTSYAAASQVTQSVTITQASQTISFPAQSPSSQTFAASGTFSINPVATGGASGNAVTYSSTTTGVCTVSGTTVTMVSVGTCTIAANQAGNTNYTAASQVTQSISIGQASQTISFPAQSPSSQTYAPSGTFSINPVATGGASGNAVTYSSTTTGVCTVSGTTVTMVSVGICTIAANQAGNSNYTAASQVTQNVSITQASQSITFGTQVPASQTYSASGTFAINPVATGGASGNSVTYTSTTTGVCTVSGTTVTIVSAGTCTIAANQAGNSNYTAASQVTQNVTIGQASQTISFPAQSPATQTYAASGTFAINPVATGGASGNSVTYSSTTAGVCTVSGTTVTIVATGTCTVAADQAGNTNYAAASQVTQNVTIGKATQIISFPVQSPSSRTFAASSTFPINPVATGGASGNAVTYSSTTTGICTVSGTTVTMVAVGTCTIAADQAGNSNYNAATQVTQNVAIGLISQTITFGAQTSPVTFVASGTFAVNPLATGGGSPNPVTYSSLSTGVCTISGTTVTMVSAGTCMIAADQAGDATYAAASQVTQNVTINQASQTITFGTQVPSTQTFSASGTFAVNPLATGGASGNAVTYTSTTTGVCTISGTTITIVAAGTCTIAANQAGNSNYTAASQVTQNITIGQASQTISFPVQSPATQTFVASGTFAINPVATGGASGNSVTYSSTTTGVCTVSGTTVTMVAAGTCTIAANQAGNANYAAATQVTQNITVGKASQTITFAAQSPSTQTFSASGTFAINPVATGGASGNAVTYSSTTTGVCTVSGTTVTMVSVGTCTIAANQAGNGNYNAATQVTQNVTIGQASQTISFPAQSPATQTFAASGTFAINPVATGGASGNAVTYSSTTTGVCTVSGTTVTMVSVGTCTIAANQAGNSNYTAALQVTQDVTITQASQTISFATQVPSTRTYSPAGTFSVNPVATGGASGNAVIYGSATTGVCTVSGSTVTIVSAGTCTITADQSGNSNYFAASQVTQNVTITQASQAITFGAQVPSTQTFSAGGTFGVSPVATGGASGNAVTYSSTTTGVCTVSGTTVTMVAAGTCTIAANQAGNTNYAAATQATQSVTITKAAQTIVFGTQAQPTQVFSAGGTFAINPTATGGASGNAVTYSSLTASVCTVSGTTVSMVATGTCTIAADQAGNGNYNAATQVTQSVTVTIASQTIAFAAQVPSSQPFSPAGTFAISPLATGGASGNAVTYSSLSTSVCTVAGTTVTIVSAGSCSIAADQAGNANYSAAPQVSQSVTINQASQTISWGAQSNQAFGTGGTFAISPTATGGASGNSIVYTSATTGVCTVSGTTVTKISVGTCTLNANQAGDTNYSAATQVQRSLSITASVATAPVATTITASDSQVVIEFTPSSSDGGSTITGYTATCTASGQTTRVGNGSASPITVGTVALPMTNGVQYSCTVVANNAAGSSPASNTLTATPFLDSGVNLWTNVCSACHGATPAGVRFNAAGQTGNVINYVRSVQPVMLGQSAVQAFTLNELAEIAKYIETFVPAITKNTAFNTAVNVDVSSHLTLGTVSFETAEVVTAPLHGSLGAFTGTTITYTPTPGYVGSDTFTYRGNHSAPGVPGDAHTVTINIAAPPAPVITSASIFSGVFGTPTSYLITATNSPTSYAATPLGSGFTVDPVTGLISGTPNAAGSFTVTISATNAGGTGMQSVMVTVSKASQSITFGAQSGQTFSSGGTFSLNPVATTTSPLMITYSSLTTSVCTISGTTVTIVTAGTCTIAADQAGNTNYNVALQVTQGINIAATVPGAPTIGTATPGSTVAAIGFTPPANNGGSAINSYTATCVSAGHTTRTGSATASPINVASLDDNFTYSCTVVANNAVGSGPSSSSVNVTPTPVLVAPQITSANSTTFTVLSAGTFNVTATGNLSPNITHTGGSLPAGVTFTPGAGTGVLSGTPASGTASGSPYSLTFTATNASGNPTQSFSLTVQKANQTISFTGPSSQPFTPSTIILTATANSSLTVTLTSNTTSVCTVSGSTLTLVTVGTCSITATQAGDANYNAATPVTQGFTVSQASQTITFLAQSPSTQSFLSGSTFSVNPTASASSGLAISYSSTTGSVCTVVGTTVTMVAPGTCTIAANQSGSANYLAATQVTRSVSLNATVPGAPTIGIATSGNGQATIAFTAPTNNGGSAITGYLVTCSPAGGTDTHGGTTALSHLITGLTNGTTYTCSVVASNAVGSSAASATVQVIPLSGQGGALWTQVCDVCHTSVPSGNQLNGAGTTATVINYVRTNQTLMAGWAPVQNLTDVDIADIAAYISSNIPPNDVSTVVNVPVTVDVNNHITLTGQTWSAFTSVEVVTGPSHGSLGAFSGTQILYTPTPGYVGTDSFTYRGKHTGTSNFVGDPQTVNITIWPASPVVTSSTNATGTFGQAFNYQITASNTPTSFGASGLPGGLSVSTLGGAISGTPTETGLFSIPISATNAGGTGNATLTLQIDPAAQVITFPAQTTSSRSYSAGGTFAIAPTATGGASPNPIVYGSNSPSVCTVSGTTVTIVSTGTCILTADQAGNADYAAATQKTANVTINAVVPGAPVIGTATGGNAQATVTFTAPSSNGGSAITGYTVTSNPAGGVDSNAGSTGLSHVITGLTNGTAYTFTVTASNAAGTGAASAASNSVTPAALTAPGAPTGATATAGNATATVTFTTPASNGGSAITGYTVTSNPAGGVDSNAGSTGLSHAITGLTNGTAYTFTVTATNAIGTGAASSASNSVTPSTVPGAPTGATATAGNTQATVVFAAPSSNGGSAITGYTVTSNPAGGVDSNAGTTGLSHVITGLTNGTAYIFTVIATNSQGAGAASAASNSVTPATVPGAPTAATATAGNAQATVTFSAPSSNGGSAITGYTVTSNPAGGVDSNAGSTGLSHVITGLTNGTAYTFTVTASNAAGTGAASAASNSVTPTALAFTGTVMSRKTHGGIDRDMTIPNPNVAIAGAVTVEPRNIGAGHRIVFVFNNAVTSVTSVAATDSLSASVGSATASFPGNNELVVTLTGIPDATRVTVTVTGANNQPGVNASAVLGFLVGDINSSRGVNAVDISTVKARQGAALGTGTNYLFDIDLSGAIDNADVTTVKSKSGRVLP